MPFENLGIQSTEEFSMEGSNPLEDFLSGNTPSLEKIDPKKKPAAQKPDPKKPAEKKEDEEEEIEEQEEEPINILDALDEEEENDDEKKPEAKKKEEPAKDDEEQPESATEFEVIADQLLQLGIFTEDEETELPKTAEEFAQRFQEEKQKGAVQWLENFLANHGEDRRELFEAIFVSGVDPKEYIPVYNQVQDFEGLDMAVESNQEKVYREYYKRLKWSDERIEKNLQKLKDYGDLAEEAAELHPQIVEQDKDNLAQQKLAKEQATAQKKAIEQQYHASVQKTLLDAVKSKELQGFPLTEAKAKEVASLLLTPKYKLPNGDVITEFDKMILESKKPENIKDRIMFALLKSNNFDFSKIEKKAVSKESNELFSQLKKKAVKSNTVKASQETVSGFEGL